MKTLKHTAETYKKLKISASISPSMLYISHHQPSQKCFYSKSFYARVWSTARYINEVSIHLKQCFNGNIILNDNACNEPCGFYQS